jgi:WD40 repeat protein
VRVWDAVSGKELPSLKGHAGAVTGVACSPDGRRLASSSWDGTVRLWDATTGYELFSLQAHKNSVDGVAFSPDGQRLASAGDETVRVWDAATRKELLTLKGHTGSVWSMSFSPDGRRLASASEDQTVRLWDAATGKKLHSFRHTHPVRCVAFGPDGRRLASARLAEVNGAESSQDEAVRIWDTATGQELLALKGHTSSVYGVAFSPDGRRLASASLDQTVRVWDAASGKELLTLKGHTRSVDGVAFSPDGRRLASAGDETVRIWDAATGQELLALKGHTMDVNGVAFSPDGRWLASAGHDQTVRIWEASPVPENVWHQRRLVSQVNFIFEKHLSREEVLAALRKAPTLSEPDRQFALQVARSHSETPIQLNEAARKVVKIRGAGKEAYAQAQRQAEAAVIRAPDNWLFLNTLGAAEFRAGRYLHALGALTRSEQLNATKEGPHRVNLAFLAMTQHQLGKKDEAKATLDRLREVMKQSRWAEDAESVSFMLEAEELIEGKMGDEGARNKKPALAK